MVEDQRKSGNTEIKALISKIQQLRGITDSSERERERARERDGERAINRLRERETLGREGRLKPR